MFKDKRTIAFFLAPTLVGFSVFYLIPFIGGIYYSMTNNAFQLRFVGINNYIDVLRNEVFQLALKNTLIFTCISVFVIMILSFLLATSLHDLGSSGSWLSGGIVLPLTIPSASIILVWKILFADMGYINRLFTSLGFEPILWTSDRWIRAPIILLYVWRNCGFNMTLFSAGLSNISKSYYESASLEGAGWWSLLIHITLPLIFPTTFLVFVMSIIHSFTIFKEAFLLYGTYPSESIYLVQHYLNNHFDKLNYETLTTAAYIFAFIIYVFIVIIFKIETRKSEGRY